MSIHSRARMCVAASPSLLRPVARRRMRVAFPRAIARRHYPPSPRRRTSSSTPRFPGRTGPPRQHSVRVPHRPSSASGSGSSFDGRPQGSDRWGQHQSPQEEPPKKAGSGPTRDERRCHRRHVVRRSRMTRSGADPGPAGSGLQPSAPPQQSASAALSHPSNSERGDAISGHRTLVAFL